MGRAIRCKSSPFVASWLRAFRCYPSRIIQVLFKAVYCCNMILRYKCATQVKLLQVPSPGPKTPNDLIELVLPAIGF